MYKITLDDPADDMLLWLKSRDKYMHTHIVKAIDEIEKIGTQHTQIKKLSHIYPIYRRRVGRWRIVFTCEPDGEIVIWIIDIEKDTKKDYGTWITKITQRRQSRFG